MNFTSEIISVLPSKLATIEYTTKDDRDLKTNCIHDSFGQLGNEDLHTPLYNRSRPYRSTTCKLDHINSEVLQCEGRITVHDYKPRYYRFSFGYHCEELVRPSLSNLSFNFTISGQTNETTCTEIPELDDGFFNCHQLYLHTSLPNLVGISSTDILGKLRVLGPLMGILLSSNGRLCYKYAQELSCHIIYPECDPIKRRVINPCKESCSEFFEACSKIVTSALKRLDYKGSYFSPKLTLGRILSEFVDCNYLPVLNGPIPCYYKPVTCDPPPNVTNARIINGIKPNEIYLAKSQVEYECLNQTFQMEGTSTITCLYSGHWDKTLMCERRDKGSNPLSIVLPFLLIPIFVFILTHIIKRHVLKKKKTHEYLTRGKKYDAFVCYEYNPVDQGFAEDTITMELEEKCDPSFKLCLHRRDFKAAWDIMWNIRNAIQNSNSAIIVMSQEYVDSLWCKEEFEQCYMEHMKDSAFRLFVIMMQPVEDLKNTSEYMKSFFTYKTYLERGDPELFRKICDYLSWVKKPNNTGNIKRKKDLDEEEELI